MLMFMISWEDTMGLPGASSYGIPPPSRGKPPPPQTRPQCRPVPPPEYPATAGFRPERFGASTPPPRSPHLPGLKALRGASPGPWQCRPYGGRSGSWPLSCRGRRATFQPPSSLVRHGGPTWPSIEDGLRRVVPLSHTRRHALSYNSPFQFQKYRGSLQRTSFLDSSIVRDS